MQSLSAPELDSLDFDYKRFAGFVDDGGVEVGHTAIARVMSNSRSPALRIAGYLIGHRALVPIARRVYGWVSDNRHRLPGGSTSCVATSPNTCCELMARQLTEDN